MVPSEDRSGPGTTSWSLHPSLETFSCQLARHFAAPCPAFRHFIQSCMPNLHLPPLTGLLQPLDMLKCQHIGFPASVFRAKPVSSSGNWGAGLSAGLGRLKGFFGTGLGLFGSGSNGLFGGCCAATLGIAIKWTLILGSCINLSKGSSRGGLPPAAALSDPLCSDAKIEKISLSARITWVKVMALKLLGASETKVDISLSNHFWHTLHDSKFTRSNARWRLCSAKYNLSSVLVSMSCKFEITVCFKAPCSSVIIVFDLFFCFCLHLTFPGVAPAGVQVRDAPTFQHIVSCIYERVSRLLLRGVR